MLGSSSFWHRWRAAGDIAWTWRLVWKSSRGRVGFLGLLTLVSATTPVLGAWLAKLLIDQLLVARAAVDPVAKAAAVERVLFLVFCELMLVLVGALVERYVGILRSAMGRRLSADIRHRVVEKALDIDLAQLEDPVHHDQLTRARREASTRPLSLIQQKWVILRCFLTLGLYAGLIWNVHPMSIVLLVMAGLPAFFAETKHSRRGFRLQNDRAPSDRLIQYLENALTGISPAKEIRQLDIGRLLLGRHRVLTDVNIAKENELIEARAQSGYIWTVISTLALYVCLALPMAAAARGDLSLGTATFFIIALRQVQQSFQSLLSAVGGIYEDSLYIANLRLFLEIKSARQATPRSTKAERSRIERGLRFDAVSFRYPGKSQYALRNINCYVPPGGHLGIVGENGAGKTTFIKLLCGLYVPGEGQIYLDGRPLADWPTKDLVARYAVLFQDYTKFHLSVRDNVGFGAAAKIGDDDAIQKALRRADAMHIPNAGGAGLETVLSRQFDGGIDISGGEWQRVALARVFMRASADIVIVDEPSSHLDLLAGITIIDNIKAVTRDKTLICISHQIDIVKDADNIIFLRKGEIAEAGSHASLLAANGEYVRLFEKQLKLTETGRAMTA
jgi:ATP-binding cassette subfamily B protein